MPRKQHEPTKATQDTVTMHAMVGTPQEIIADVLGIDAKTLRKHYRRELDLSSHKANAEIGGALFNKAKGGDTAAQIFWLKTRAGFTEKQAIEHTSPDGSMSPGDPEKIREELERLGYAKPKGQLEGKASGS